MNTSGYGRVVSGTLLTQALKRLRQASGQQQKQVADALEWPASKLILIEDGGASISVTDVKVLLRYYGMTDQDQAGELIARARDARVPGWWERFPIQDKAFERYVGYESDATSIRMAQGLLVPGLLQTEEYANLMTPAYAPPGEADPIVLLRLERQKEVSAREPEQYYLLDEAVLRRRVGDVMPAQLRRLADLARQPKITIRVIPFGAGPHFGLRGPFVLLGFDVPIDNVLFLESARRGDLIVSSQEILSGQGTPGVDGAAEIARYEDGFEALSRMALSQAESISLLEQIASQ